MIGIQGYGIHVKLCLGLPRSKRAGKPNPIQWPAVLAPPRKNFHNKLVSALGVPRVLQTIAAYVPAGPALLGSLCRRARELLVALEPEKGHAEVDSGSDNGDWMFEDVFAADLSAEGGGGAEQASGRVVDSGLSVVGAEGQDTGPVRFPTFPVATPNPLVRREDLTPVWSSNAESHDSETLADLQRACIQAWKETPELGYFGSSQTQVQPPKAVVASNAFNTPIFGAGKSDKERYKNNKRK